MKHVLVTGASGFIGQNLCVFWQIRVLFVGAQDPPRFEWENNLFRDRYVYLDLLGLGGSRERSFVAEVEGIAILVRLLSVSAGE